MDMIIRDIKDLPAVTPNLKLIFTSIRQKPNSLNMSCLFSISLNLIWFCPWTVALCFGDQSYALFPPLITECVRMDPLLSWLQEVTSPYDPVQDLTARIPAVALARYATWQVLRDPGGVARVQETLGIFSNLSGLASPGGSLWEWPSGQLERWKEAVWIK